MRSILIDAGPLIALFDRSDAFHRKSVKFLEDFNGSLLTTWPVITEASHMLDFSQKAQGALLEWIRKGGLNIFALNETLIKSLIMLTNKSDDVPMDLADASLIVASEDAGIGEIASIDTDFYIYRDVRNQYLNNVFM